MYVQAEFVKEINVCWHCA